MKIENLIPLNKAASAVYFKHVMGKDAKKAITPAKGDAIKKVSDEDVMKIRYLCNHLGWSDKVVAKKFGVVEGTIYHIRRYETRLKVIAPFDVHGFNIVIAEKWGRENGMPTKGGVVYCCDGYMCNCMGMGVIK